MIKQLLNSAFVSSEELWRSRRVLFDEFVLAAKKGYIMTTPCLNDTPIHDGINAKLFRLRLMWIRLTKGVQLFLTKLLSFLHHSMCEPKTSHNPLSYYDEGLGVREGSTFVSPTSPKINAQFIVVECCDDSSEIKASCFSTPSLRF